MGKGIGEGGGGFFRVPWGGVPEAVGVKRYEPGPYQGIEEQAESGGAHRSLIDPSLGVMWRKRLFGVTEGDFNGPSVGEVADDGSGVISGEGGDEEIIRLNTFRVSADDNTDRGFAHGPPERLERMNKSDAGLATLSCMYFFPRGSFGGGNCFQGLEALTVLSGAAWFAFSALNRGESIECGIASNAGDCGDVGEVFAHQAGVESIRCEAEAPIGEPFDNSLDHVGGKFNEAVATLAVKAYKHR